MYFRSSGSIFMLSEQKNRVEYLVSTFQAMEGVQKPQTTCLHNGRFSFRQGGALCRSQDDLPFSVDLWTCKCRRGRSLDW